MPSANYTEWRLHRVTWRAGAPHYERITGGRLNFSARWRGPQGFIRDLMRVAWHLEKTWATEPVPEAPRDPLRGDGGDVPLPGLSLVQGDPSQRLSQGLDSTDGNY